MKTTLLMYETDTSFFLFFLLDTEIYLPVNYEKERKREALFTFTQVNSS